MNLKTLYTWYSQFGGFNLLREYSRLGVLSVGIKSAISWFVGKGSFKGIFINMLRKVEPLLRNQYLGIMYERKEYYGDLQLIHKRSRKVWFCWLQGLDSAPPIVNACYKSQLIFFPDREIIVVDYNNWKNYVELPEYVIKRWERKQIPPANFSDLIRLELLTRYGGTWIDATVLCTGINHSEAFLNADLFLFQYTRPGCNTFGGISNWFISSCTNNEVLLVLRDMLYAYWKDYDCLLDYYIFHLFFSMLQKDAFHHEIANMPYGFSSWSLFLVKHWGEAFDQDKWDRLISQVNFHKLTHRVDKKLILQTGNYFNWIINNYEDFNSYSYS